MNEVYATIDKVENKEVKLALKAIAAELQRIRDVRPTDVTVTNLAYAINKITGNI